MLKGKKKEEEEGKEDRWIGRKERESLLELGADHRKF